MCWEINKKEFDIKPWKYHKVAQEDIFVYKVGWRYKSVFLPVYRGWNNFEYKFQKTNINISLQYKTVGDTYRIKDGYHSYLGKCCCMIDKCYGVFRASKYTFDYINALKITIYTVDNKWPRDEIGCYEENIKSNISIGKFIIPKGTEYFINDNNEVVSSNIIWTGESHMLSSFEQDIDIDKDIKTLWTKAHNKIIKKKLNNICVGE